MSILFRNTVHFPRSVKSQKIVHDHQAMHGPSYPKKNLTMTDLVYYTQAGTCKQFPICKIFGRTPMPLALHLSTLLAPNFGQLIF